VIIDYIRTNISLFAQLASIFVGATLAVAPEPVVTAHPVGIAVKQQLRRSEMNVTVSFLLRMHEGIRINIVSVTVKLKFCNGSQ
jgi:hypothetical protein